MKTLKDIQEKIKKYLFIRSLKKRVRKVFKVLTRREFVMKVMTALLALVLIVSTILPYLLR